MCAFMFGLPILWSPALLPLAADSLLDWADLRHGLPVALVLSVAICAGVIVIYRLALNWQGDMLQAREHRAADLRIGDEWDVERGCFLACGQRVAYVVPARRVVSVKVDVDAGTEVGVHANTRVANVDQGLATVTADRLEPVDRVRRECPGAVVLRTANHIGFGPPQVDR